ncbi:MAG: hypothetical protein ACLU9S_11865 [Oscillospiraceae bacterium]
MNGEAARLPLGPTASPGDTLLLTGMFCREDGSGFWRASIQGPAGEAERWGRPWQTDGGMTVAGKVWLVGAGPSDGGF